MTTEKNTAGDKALINRFNKILELVLDTRKTDPATGEKSEHVMPIRQLATLLEVAYREGQVMQTYTMAGDNKVTQSKNLRALSKRGSRDTQVGFGFIEFREALVDARYKEVYLTDEGKTFIKRFTKQLKGFCNERNQDKE